MRLYKYRGFENLEFALDIFVNQRLFAADFRSLNDPMEGRFVYAKGALSRGDLQRIRGSKSEYKILSLSATPNNLLMWSYYSQGHQGFVVGVDVVDTQAEIEKVEYVDDLSLDNDIYSGTGGDIARCILTRKLKLWDHEKEHRVFTFGSPFVQVEIKELIFGLDADPRQMDLLASIAKRFCSGIEVRQMDRSSLEMGELDEHDI